jgi:hypothetical protein
LGEEAFGARAICGYAISLCNGYQVFCARENKDIRCIIVVWYAFRRFAADTGEAQIPAEPEWSIPIAGAVNKIKLGLETVASVWQGERDGEVAGAGMEVW